MTTGGRTGSRASSPCSRRRPRFAGKLADLFPLQNTVRTAVQAAVVLGVAGEHGVKDPAERIALLSRVLLKRELPPGQVEPLLVHTRAPTRTRPSAPAAGRCGPCGGPPAC